MSEHPREQELHEACATNEIPFGPRGCLQAREELHALWGLGDTHHKLYTVRGGSEKYEKLAKAHILEATRLADLYWVSPEMCDLINTAEPSVPLDVSLQDELLPSGLGLIFFARKRVGCLDAFRPETGPVYVDVLHWHTAVVPRNNVLVPELIIHSYTYHGLPGALTRWFPLGQGNWVRGARIDDRSGSDSEEEYVSCLEDRRLLMAFFGLIKSPGIAEIGIERPDRAAARRAARLGTKANNDVRVIYLRSPSGGGGEYGEGSKYNHRWIVSGHWRSQPYGPGRVHRKPVWIAPHVKGPDGAPMLHGEKVRAVVR